MDERGDREKQEGTNEWMDEERNNEETQNEERMKKERKKGVEEKYPNVNSIYYWDEIYPSSTADGSF